jgi:tetratricopeptide (TPR) repeat protein
MNMPTRLWVVLICFGLVTGKIIAQTSFDEELNLGVQAYRQAKYEEAIQHFQNARDFAPQKWVAHLYLATAYAQQYIPGVETPNNTQWAEGAVAEYQALLRMDPGSMESIKGIAYIRLQQKRFEEARTFYHKAVELDARDPENYYSIGVIDWTQAYTRRMADRVKLNLKPGEPLINKAECWAVRSDNEDLIKDGIENLSKALGLRRDYDDGMAYMNLMYRERADTQCNDPINNQSDLKVADHWVDVTIATKKAKAAKYNGGGQDTAALSNRFR